MKNSIFVNVTTHWKREIGEAVFGNGLADISWPTTELKHIDYLPGIENRAVS